MASILKVDEMQGVTSAGDITITGEGTATMRLQQGLAKGWCSVDHDTSTTFHESFNFSSVTDNSTGSYTCAFTNAMNFTRYSAPTSCYSGDGDITNIANEATANFRLRVFNDTGAAADVDCFTAVFGDLA